MGTRFRGWWTAVHDRGGAGQGRHREHEDALLCCPWSPIYVVKRPIEIGARRLRHLQQFTYDVFAEEMGEGGRFKREIVVANFEPTQRVDYCDPTQGGHHDDH